MYGCSDGLKCRSVVAIVVVTQPPYQFAVTATDFAISRGVWSNPNHQVEFYKK